MTFRFVAAIVLLVAISLLGIGIEKQNLELKRGISLQHYRLDQLLEQHARLRLRTQRLGAPALLFDRWERGELQLEEPDRPLSGPRVAPLLEWRVRQAAAPEPRPGAVGSAQ